MVMLVELQATCSALGYQEGNQYVKEPDCLETVKDLIKFLKREDETCDIRRQLGYAQILQNDLLPILKSYHTDRDLFETNIRLLVNLTQPAVLCFNNHVPTDKTLRNYYLEVESYLQSYKEAFVDEEVFNVLTERLGELLKLDWEHRQEEDRLLIERILVLIRNVLHVPPNLDKEQRTDDDASVHDQVIWALHCSGLEDLLLFIASSEEERNLSMHVLEIVSLMFREQTPDMLASAGVSRSMTEKEKDERELEMVREQEKAQKRANMMKFSTRHSRFGGTYVVRNMKSISDREVIYHKNQKDVANLTFDENKKPKKKAKNRQPIKDEELHRRSTLSIRLALKEFCVQFLESCYNPLMYAVKDILNREKAQDHDETYYLWAMRFFMEFCRLHSQQIELVSETMSVPTFHYIQVQLFQYYEMIMMEKKEAKVWAKRMHLALKAYQELLNTLDAMDKSHSSQLRESSKVIKGNIFYMMEFRDIFLTLLRKFNESSQSRTYLKDLVETTHLFLKMLENMSKSNTHFVVQKKKTKSQKRKKKQKAASTENLYTPDQLEDMWDEVSGELSALFQGRGELPTDVTPFDAASEVDVDQQRADAMMRIQDMLREKKPGHAIALFRAAREVWPERNEFGTPDISAEDEFMALREIFMADIPRPQSGETNMEEDMDYDDLAGHEIEEEEMQEVVTSEQKFNFKEFVMKFAKPDIVKPYVILLADFSKNSSHTNHCVLKMLHRIAVDIGLPGLMFQASLFRVFQKIMCTPLAKTERYKEISKFAAFIVRHFVEAAQRNTKIFMELLFWKSHREAVEIMDGYGSYQGKAKQAWTEDQEVELRRLFEECNQTEEGDVADKIMERITDPTKTRGQIIRELKRQELIDSAKDLKRKTGATRVTTWTEEQEYELKDLYEKYKDSGDIINNILANLSIKRGKSKVIEKLFALGLVNDRKELYKRRNRKGKPKNPWEEGANDAPIVDDWSDEEEGRARGGASGRGSDLSEEEMSDSLSDSESDDDSSGSSESDGDQSDKVEDRGVQNGEASSHSGLEQEMCDLIDKGYKDQLLWIQRAVKRKADDKETKGSHVSVPVVPLTEENETAMEDEMFTSFLQKLGISPPANEQEAFWRIPGELTLSELRCIQEGLTIGDDGRPTSADKLTAKQVRPERKKKEKEKKPKKKKEKKKKLPEKFNALRDMVKRKKEEKDEGRLARRERKRQSLEDGSTAPMEVETDLPDGADGSTSGSQQKEEVTTSAKKTRRVKRLIDSDSDDSDKENMDKSNEEMESDNEEETTPTQSQSLSQSQKRPLDFGDSSDDDDDDEPLMKRPRTSSESGTSEENLNKNKERRGIIDDDEDDKDDDKEDDDDEEPSPVRKAKAKTIVSDDSEEEEEEGQKDESQSASFPATLYTQNPDDSDSDVDDHIPLRRVLQKKSIIESDDED